MADLTLNVENRIKSGKGVARSLRKEGHVPAVLHHKGVSRPIQLARKDLLYFIKSTGGEQVMVNLKFPDGDSKYALLKDYQTDPIKGELLHTDFLEVSLTETIKVTAHLSIVGEAVGVKRDGGILQNVIREVEIECLPDKIPGHINIDVSKLEIGQSVHVGDLKFGEGIKLITDPKQAIVSIVAPRAEEVAAPVEAAPAAAETAEPEVIKKGKKEKEEAEPAK